MYYHVIIIYVIIILVCAALIYLYVDEFNEKKRITLFVESANSLVVTPSTSFVTLYSYDTRYEKIKGKVKIYIKFVDANKNNIITVRVADINEKSISKEIILSDERTGEIEFNVNGSEEFLRIQTKTSSSIIQLERLEIEY